MSIANAEKAMKSSMAQFMDAPLGSRELGHKDQKSCKVG